MFEEEKKDKIFYMQQKNSINVKRENPKIKEHDLVEEHHDKVWDENCEDRYDFDVLFPKKEENLSEDENYINELNDLNEDEDDITEHNNSTKAEEEQQQQKQEENQSEELDINNLLKTKIKLDDGSEFFVFSRGPKYSDNSWPINCHLCRMGNLITEEQINFHIKGKRHLIRLKKKKPDPKLFIEPFFQCMPEHIKSEVNKQIKIYPGEIIDEITEEYKDRVIKPEEFEIKLPSNKELLSELRKEPIHDYNEKLPVIGLCYMYKMNGYKGLTYFCTLCNMRLSKDAFEHVTSEEHQIKYIMRHFPKTFDKVFDRLSKVHKLDVHYNLRNIFRKLYRKIENAKGFRKISIVDANDFFKNLKKYLLKTRFDEHYGETTIPITEHEVDILLRKCFNEVEFICADHKPEDNAVECRDGINFGRPIKRRQRGGSNCSYNWEKYRELMQREINILNSQYQIYNCFPTKHSRYKKEENKYFSLRKRKGQNIEIIKRDWSLTWTERLKVFYNQDIINLKIKIRKMLHLPLDVKTPSSSPQRIHKLDNSPNYKRMKYPDRHSISRNVKPTLPGLSMPLDAISCLRLLTALEEHLGSLGPKVVQLLSRAVIIVKNGTNPNNILMEGEFYLCFLTAIEMLKGQLLVNVTDSVKIKAITHAIKDCTTLMEMFEDYLKREGIPLPCFNLNEGLKIEDSLMNQHQAGLNQCNTTNIPINDSHNYPIINNYSNGNNDYLGDTGNNCSNSSNNYQIANNYPDGGNYFVSSNYPNNNYSCLNNYSTGYNYSFADSSSLRCLQKTDNGVWERDVNNSNRPFV